VRTQLRRHRPSQEKAASILRYSATARRSYDALLPNGSAAAAQPVRVWACDAATAAALAGMPRSRVVHDGLRFSPWRATEQPSAAVRGAFGTLAAGYEAFTAAEARRSLEWVCAWGRLSDA
jgi:hypothetical protein